ncbi:vitamin K epoxide reductase family protein [Kribbella kalugense]|uniref:Putative membrane protein n=1 Tax=Kribbella kalugense TaxID=2512221 RepID=A0A4R8A1S4_9ACTN|nr:vitamin K epoxide reductase family protein [Kribbella kalugense]TDW24477.1 putative membrane protein [Kribbella kalugense]
MTHSTADVTSAPIASSTDRAGLPERGLAWLLLVGGSIGFVAAFVLTVERYKLLSNPLYVPSCSINSVLSCSSVMTSSQATAFGFPNPLLGIAGFAVVATIGVVLLTGAQLPRWFGLGLQLGATLAVIFVHWLMYQSIYRIGALCPYCMVVWAVTIPIFWYTTLHNLIQTKTSLPRQVRGVVGVLAQYHGVVVTAWILFIGSVVITRFWLSNG